MNFEEYKPLPTQLKAHVSPSKYKLFGGIMNCGKSYWLAAEAIRLSIMFAGNEGVLVRYRGKDLRKTTLRILEEMIPPKILIAQNKSEGYIDLRSCEKSKPSRIWMMDAEDPNKFKSMNLGWYGIEEATDIKDVNAFNMLNTRLRRFQPDDSKHFGLLTCNPEPGWVKEKFLDVPIPNSEVFFPDWQENPAHTVSYRQTLQDTLPPDLFARYLCNSWDSFDSQIFLANQIIVGEPTKPIMFKVIAVDPAIAEGEHADETAIITLGIEAETNLIHVLEVIHGRWDFTTIIDNIESAYKRQKPDLLGIEYVAFQKAIGDVLQRKGIPIQPLRADTDKIRRAMSVSYFMQQKRVRVNQIKLQRQLLEFPNATHDDLVDAFVYALRLIKENSEEKYSAPAKDKFAGMDSLSENFWRAHYGKDGNVADDIIKHFSI